MNTSLPNYITIEEALARYGHFSIPFVHTCVLVNFFYIIRNCQANPQKSQNQGTPWKYRLPRTTWQVWQLTRKQVSQFKFWLLRNGLWPDQNETKRKHSLVSVFTCCSWCLIFTMEYIISSLRGPPITDYFLTGCLRAPGITGYFFDWLFEGSFSFPWISSNMLSSRRRSQLVGRTRIIAYRSDGLCHS